MNYTTARRNVPVDILEPRRMFSRRVAVISAFTETALVSNVIGQATVTDVNLINPWGIAFNPTLDVLWTANNGAGNSTVYNSDGTIANTGGLYDSITIPPPVGSTSTSLPTGAIFNNSSSFVVNEGLLSGAAAYLFSTEDGTIAGWNPTVDPTNAITMVDRSALQSVYKGLAQATRNGARYIYATDFRNGKVNAFDSNFQPVFASKRFVDPNLPKHYAPFGIQNINGQLYVTYAKQDATQEDNVVGAATGVVSVFSYKGKFLRRFATGGTLNAPWGVAQAPSTFGKLAGAVLVSNFGNGTISAFNASTGKLIGLVGDTSGNSVISDGLWGLAFGPTTTDSNTLFFTAGPNSEANGLLGTLTVPTVTPAPTAIPVPSPFPSTAIPSPIGTDIPSPFSSTPIPSPFATDIPSPFPSTDIPSPFSSIALPSPFATDIPSLFPSTDIPSPFGTDIPSPFPSQP